MKTYRCIIFWKIIFLFTIVLMGCGFLYVFPQLNILKVVFLLGVLLFFVFTFISLFYVEIKVNTMKLEMRFDITFYKVIQVVEWDKIIQIDSDYFFFPQIGGIEIKCPSNNNQPKMEIPITFFPSALLKDILNNAPKNVEVNLYPWLQNQLRKQENRDRVI